jgi:hypothetical protein
MPEQKKIESILELPAPCIHKDPETVRDLMIAYVYESCTPEERLDFELHCRLCDECLTMLAIIQDLLSSPISDEEEETRTLALSEVGWEAAETARLSSIAQVPTPDSGRRLKTAA